jgi:septation ring formation regulator EzrA
MNVPINITRIFDELKYEIKHDSFNLTQLDHDAIEIQINNLINFIKDRYETHGRSYENI